MDDSFHYLSMINHMTIQKKLMEQLADTGLTLGRPKSIGLPEKITMVPARKRLRQDASSRQDL